MPKSDRKAPPPPDPENGIWQGRGIARRFVSPDGMTLRLGAPRDFWFHVAAESGSHVVVRNPEGLDRCPKETEQFAASLAAGYSKARKGGRVAVHVCRCEEVSKPRGFPPGKVLLERFKSVQVAPWRPDAS